MTARNIHMAAQYKLSRLAGVSEAPAERESAGEILSEQSESKDPG